MDRIDIHIEAPSVDYEKFISSYSISKISLSIRKRIKGARDALAEPIRNILAFHVGLNPKMDYLYTPRLSEVWKNFCMVHGYFVQEHRQKRWLWISMCRRTYQIIAYAIGDCSQKTCQLL